MLVSLLHYSHPEYLRVVIFDPKAAAFKAIDEVVNVFNFGFDEIAETILKIDEIMRKRIKITSIKGAPEDAKSMNAYAYKHRSKLRLMPYIVIIFDEFAQFSVWAQKHKPEAMEAIIAITSMGLGVGINFILATQSPYKRFIQGWIKCNFENNICFKVRNFTQENLILGKGTRGERSATSLRRGEFIIKENGRNKVYSAVFCSQKTFQSAAKNWEERGFNYKLF